MQKNLEKKITEASITAEVEEFGEIRMADVPDSELSETSCFRSQRHFDDSVESIADSDLEDGELQKMLTSPLYAQNSSEKTRCNGHAGERGQWHNTLKPTERSF